MKLADLQISRVVLSDIEENAYLVSRKGRDDCVLVDPGMEAAPFVAQIQASNLTPKAILITHGHWDHIGGIGDVRKIWPDVPVFIGENDASKLTDPNGNLSVSFFFPLTTVAADRPLKDGETFEIAGIPFETREIPGHSRGHVVYLIPAEDGDVVFCGDVLFCGSVGRTDFPDSDPSALLRGIRDKILPLPDATVLLTGHGPATTVGAEKKTNPYLAR